MNKNMKIAYDPKFLSDEELNAIDCSNNDIELIKHSLNSNAPKNDLILSVCLFLINSVVSGVVGNFTYDMLKIAYRNFRQKHIFYTDSSNNKTSATAKVIINDGKDKIINLIFEKEPTDIEWLNINDMIKHLKNGGYIVKLNENGRINIWTSLEYAQYRYAQQKKK